MIRYNKRYLVTAIFFILQATKISFYSTEAFQLCLQTNNNNQHVGSTTKLFSNQDGGERSISSSDDIRSKSIDQDLVRPPINIRKESILFGESPATARNNNISRLWKTLRQNLPYVLTGVSKDVNNELTKAIDDNPIGAIYNMVFVRLPSLLAGIIYSKNLIESHPLYCDVGTGAFEIPPLFVYGLLLIILR